MSSAPSAERCDTQSIARAFEMFVDYRYRRVAWITEKDRLEENAERVRSEDIRPMGHRNYLGRHLGRVMIPPSPISKIKRCFSRRDVQSSQFIQESQQEVRYG